MSRDAVIYQAAALVLSYPDETLLDRLPLIRDAVAEAGAAKHFAPMLAHLEGAGEPPAERLMRLRPFHVQEFDLSRRHALHLTYWTDGETRRRGEEIAAFKRAYRDSGLAFDIGGELPDYLPVVLEFAVASPDAGRELLAKYRGAVELLRLGLEDDDLPHAGVLAAICGTLPGPAPKTRADVHAMVKQIAPTEAVGIELLGYPVHPTRS